MIYDILKLNIDIHAEAVSNQRLFGLYSLYIVFERWHLIIGSATGVQRFLELGGEAEQSSMDRGNYYSS